MHATVHACETHIRLQKNIGWAFLLILVFCPKDRARTAVCVCLPQSSWQWAKLSVLTDVPHESCGDWCQWRAAPIYRVVT